jgi:energy-coupling factor transport system permease protein
MKYKSYIRYFFLFFSCFLLIAVWFPGVIYQLILMSVLALSVLLFPNTDKAFRFLLTMSPFIFMTLLIHLFLRFDSKDYWEAFFKPELWQIAGYFTLRNFNILMIVALIFSRKPLLDMDVLSVKFQKRLLKNDGKDHFFTAGFFIGLQYFRVIRDEYQSLQQVHRILGVKKEKGPFKQAGYYTSLIIPLFVGSFERADQLSVALTTRGFGGVRSPDHG